MRLSAATSPQTLPEISGYTLTEQLYLGSRTAVYRAVQVVTQQSVVIKVLRREYPSFGELVQFRNQYAITKNLSIPGIIQPLSLESLRSGYALVMEDWGGVALGKYLQQQTLHFTEVLAIALQLTEILHDLHQAHVIHKDIKPANILIHPETKQVKLIDFSIASLLPKETQEIKNPNVLEGTLAYLAPEQTGRMNRGIDYRSDFYSLGVTLYQLFTGQLPFLSDDPMELIHCHLAQQPALMHSLNLELPPILSEIVAKLLAKNAEDRYQSALGLKYDLELCLSQWRERGNRIWFGLGERDLCDRFLISEQLYGRDSEVMELLCAFDRVSAGQSELLLVSGFSGIGKTAVVNEVHKPIVRQRGYFIKGKFDQFNRNIPLSAFVQALRDLMGQLLSESDDRLAQWRTQILTALGENGQVLLEVIPELEQIIGQQPIAPELSGTTAQNRFNLLFQKFIEVFTTVEHPLVLFLDDLQWADLASLQLLKLLMNDKGYLLLLGAYRDNEVSPTHPFIMTVAELQKAGTLVNTITLKPLSFEDTNHLVADTLNCSKELAQPLTELVDRKTEGNPFFTTQFLKALHEDGLIVFNPDRRHWECDIAQVNTLTLTDDVMEFMALQLQKLPNETQHVLKLAACIGNQFDLVTLAIVSEQSATEVATALWKALQEGLVLPMGQIYKFFDSEFRADIPSASSVTPSVAYRFLHDRVQQAAYSLIPEAERATAHSQIGQLLRQQLSPSEQEERIFELVNQLNYGILLLSDRAEHYHLAQLNLLAGQKARAATAYQAAHTYAQIGINLFGEDGWHSHYKQTLALYELAAEVACLSGELEQMEDWIEAVLAHTSIPQERAKVYQIRIQALISQNNFPAAIATGRLALQQFDIHLPEQPTPDYIQQEFQSVLDLIGDRPIETLFDLPKMQDADQIAILHITISLTPVCYLSNSPLFPLVVILQVKRSIQFGNAPASCFSYASYCVLLIVMAQAIDLVDQFGQLAYRLAQEPEARKFCSSALAPLGIFVRHRKSHLQETLLILQEGYQIGVETGDLENAGYHALIFCENALWCVQPLSELEIQIRAYRQQLLDLNQLMPASSCAIYWETVLMFLDQPEAFALAREHDALIDQKKAVNDVSWLHNYHLYRCWVNFLLGHITQAEQEAIQARTYLRAVMGKQGEVGLYFYDSLIRLANLAADPSLRDLHLQQVQENQAQLQHWAHHAPMNYLHKWQLVEAERLRVTGHTLAAIALYDRAIAGAKENGFIQEEALANELAAQFYLAWGKEKIAQEYLINAYYGYAHWGAIAKVQQLERQYSVLLAPILQQRQVSLSVTDTVFATTALAASQAAGTQPSSSGSTSISATLDLTTVLKASQTLSSEIELDKLLATLLDTVLENAGADRGVLLMPHDNQWFVEAVATVDQPAQVQSIALSSSSEVPHSLINTVKRSREPMVIVDATAHLTLAMDGYMLAQQPKSLLCTPILNQGKLVAILYLENHVTVDAFTSDRILILNFLCTQAAISLENARLYIQEQQKTSELAQKEAEYRSIFESVNDGLSICNLETEQIIASNPTVCQMYGYTAEEFKQLTAVDFLHPDYLHVFSNFLTVLNSGREFTAQGLARRKDGSFFDFEAKAVPFLYKGKPHGLTIIRDISEQQAALRERNRAEADLQEKVQLLALRSAIDATLTQSKTLSEALQQCTQKIVDHLDVAFARIWLLNEANQVLELQASAGLYTHIDGPHRAVPVGQFKIGLIAQERCPHLTNDVLNDPRVSNKAWAREQGMVAFAGYPLMVDDQLLGVLAMFSRHPLPSSVLDTLNFIAHEIALGIERQQTAAALQLSEAELKLKADALTQSLQNLQETQLQMVQSEKMASLGNLVAGVAHEINNPVGFLNGSINNAKDYVQDLLDYVALYQQHHPNAAAPVQDKAEEIDLEFLSDDLPKLLSSMKGASDRIKGISISLRNFSRADAEHKVRANLHEGLDSTLLILKYRLKANERRPAIEVIQDYGDLPLVDCFPGQLNQVFMNILANAIDMFDEMVQTLSLNELKANPQQITIRTTADANQVQIQISDNGRGMAEEVRVRAFDHLFTTKGVGRGTGLGLAIARQIVVEKHGGSLEVQSELGRGTEFCIRLAISG